MTAGLADNGQCLFCFLQPAWPATAGLIEYSETKKAIKERNNILNTL